LDIPFVFGMLLAFSTYNFYFIRHVGVPKWITDSEH
jgi:hypothetical protein